MCFHWDPAASSVFAATWIFSPGCSEEAAWGISPAHHPSSIGVLPPGLSPVCRVLSLSLFKSKKALWLLLSPVQRSFTPPRSQVYPVCCQLACCLVNRPTNPKILLVTPGSEQVLVCWLFLFLPPSFSAVGRREDKMILYFQRCSVALISDIWKVLLICLWRNYTVLCEQKWRQKWRAESEVWEVPCDSDSCPPTEDSVKPNAEHYYLNC